MSGARLRIWPAITRATIAPEIYGHQIEMVGECVYEGIWTGRASRLSNEDGLRSDVLALLKHLRVPLLKWPGEAFASYYHWRDGIGTGKAREQRVNVPGQAVEPNTFGTHEFLLLCEKLGCKPWLTCNSGTGTCDEALAWLEYCTFGGDTSLTRERTHNGRPEPFEVPYWSHSSPETSSRLRALNGDISDITSLNLISNGTNRQIRTNEQPKFFAIGRFLTTQAGREFGDRSYRASFYELHVFERDLLRYLAVIDSQFPGIKTKVVLSQWGVRHPEATPENGMEQPSTLRDALLAGSVLNLLNEQAARVGMACLAEAVNALHCLVCTQGRDMFLTPTYHIFDMMLPHRGARLLYRELESPKMALPKDRSTDPRSMPALNASVSRTKKRLCITVTNQSYNEAIPLSVEMREAEIGGLTGRVLTAPSATAENSVESPKTVAPARLDVTPDGNTFHYVLPPHSFTAFVVTLK